MQPTPVTPEALLAHLDWVRRLARSLVADPSSADDLVQEAWLSATRRPPHTQNLRGWLARVLRNAAVDRRRSELRRARHEARAARSESIVDGSELADRVATQQELVQCVLELAEPYRGTVLLRYFEQLSPTQIAERTGVPLATVKTRLRRALTELRARLDASHGGDGRAWMSALLPVAQGPASVVSSGVVKGALVLMSTKSTAWIAASLGVIVLGLVLWTRDPGATRDVDVTGRVLAPEPTIVVAGEGAPARDELSSGDPGVTRSATAAGEKRVLVVDRASGTPVPGAKVWHRTMPNWSVWNDLATDREEHVRSSGAKLVTDDRGEARVPPAGPYVAVVARAGTSYGELVLHAESGDPARLEIAPDATVRVRVSDDAAKPVAGISVGVRRLTPGTGDGYGSIAALGESRAPDGVATIPHLLEREPELRAAGSWAVAAIDGAFVPPVMAQFDPRSPPADPLQLTLPPSGRVVVLVKSADGRELPDCWIGLTASVPQSLEGGRFVRSMRMDRTSRSGRAIFEHVGLGLELAIRARPSSEWPEPRVVRAGPVSAGDEVVVTVEFERGYPVITGRLLDANGAACRGASLSGRIVLTREGKQVGETALHGGTDGDGRFRIPVAAEISTETRCALHVRTGQTREGGVRTADVAVPEPLHAGDNEIGDVVLVEPAVVLSGTVRDTSGAPIYWVLVDVARRLPDVEGFDQLRYDWMPGVRAMTDELGRYVVSGDLPAGEYLVQVRHDRYVDTTLEPFTPGTRGHDVVLRRWGTLQGELRLPEGVPASRIVVEANASTSTPLGTRATGWTRGSARALPSGTFAIEGIPSGAIDVRLRLDGDPEPLVVLEGVEVPEGGATTDARLHPIDLRGSVLRSIRIRIRGPDSTRVPAAVVSVRPAGDSGAEARRILCEDGELTFVSRWPAIDVEVRAADLRTVERGDVASDVTIVMEPGIPVSIRLPASIDLPTSPDELSLVVIPESLHSASYELRLHEEDGVRDHQLYYWFSSQAQRFDERRELSFRLPEPGRYSVQLSIERRDDTGSRYASVQDRDLDFTLEASDAGRAIELDVRPSDVQEALSRMR